MGVISCFRRFKDELVNPQRTLTTYIRGTGVLLHLSAGQKFSENKSLVKYRKKKKLKGMYVIQSKKSIHKKHQLTLKDHRLQR